MVTSSCCDFSDMSRAVGVCFITLRLVMSTVCPFPAQYLHEDVNGQGLQCKMVDQAILIIIDYNPRNIYIIAIAATT